MIETAARVPPTLRRAAPALLGYAAVRALGLVALAIWSAARDKSAYTLLTARWDSLWYVRVAEQGYGYEVRLPNGDVHSNLAFFPLLPWLERLLHSLTPLSYADAGFTVSLLSSLAAAWGVFAVADHVYGARAAVYAVLVWAVLPVGIVQSMAYSESLFTALAAWALYAVLTGRWVTAGVLASLAGLTRPVGLAVVAAVWAAGLASLLRERTAPGPGSSGEPVHSSVSPGGTAPATGAQETA
ncbi:mannosyltransferase family protein, partial [Streptomyces acidiscabies]|uniref:mannosyltransferase family protein n=1 Tax=Streptomyces acidiscabies TaxID=42234 RepID=UPI0021166C44